MEFRNSTADLKPDWQKLVFNAHVAVEGSLNVTCLLLSKPAVVRREVINSSRVRDSESDLMQFY